MPKPTTPEQETDTKCIRDAYVAEDEARYEEALKRHEDEEYAEVLFENFK